MTHRPVSRRPLTATMACLTAAATALAGCGGEAAGGSQEAEPIKVIMVNNPQMRDLQKLTAANFTKETGIKVDFTVLPENDVREKINNEFSQQRGEFDVATISNFELPFFAKKGWLQPMDKFLEKDPAFDQYDILDPMRESLTADDGKLYGEPFYGESSFLMYRKDIFKRKRLRMPEAPTWEEVAELARKADGAEPGMKGICLRGTPGWGELATPLTTVVNTFGGTWFTADWKPQLTSPEFTEATEFYVDLVRAHGQPGAPQSGYAECLNSFSHSETAMWYDATVAAGSLEGPDSPVKGKIGYAPAPVDKTEHSGWLYTWAWGIQKASHHNEDAWKFVSWASSRTYEKLVGRKLGWAKVPAGKRSSTYDTREYRKAAKAFHAITRQSIAEVDPRNPGLQRRPTIGIQFVGVPEFRTLGDQVTKEISQAIAGRQTVAEALEKSQRLADQVARKYRGTG